jgi:hypothetical protein
MPVFGNGNTPAEQGRKPHQRIVLAGSAVLAGRSERLRVSKMPRSGAAGQLEGQAVLGRCFKRRRRAVGIFPHRPIPANLQHFE